MALEIVPESSPILPLQALYYGMNNSGLFITEFDTTAKPVIAGNSVIMLGGKLYRSNGTTDIAVPVGLSNGTVYIKLIPSIDGLTLSAEFTSILPAFDVTKQGRYDGDDLILNIGMTYASSGPTYSDKWQMLYIGNAYIKFRGSDNAIVADKITGAIYSS